MSKNSNFKYVLNAFLCGRTHVMTGDRVRARARAYVRAWRHWRCAFSPRGVAVPPAPSLPPYRHGHVRSDIGPVCHRTGRRGAMRGDAPRGQHGGGTDTHMRNALRCGCATARRCIVHRTLSSRNTSSTMKTHDQRVILFGKLSIDIQLFFTNL